MKRPLAWVGFLWIGGVIAAAIFCLLYAVDWVISRDTTVLPWLLLPAAAVIIAGAFVAVLPAVILFIYLGVKEQRARMEELARPTLGELTRNKRQSD